MKPTITHLDALAVCAQKSQKFEELLEASAPIIKKLVKSYPHKDDLLQESMIAVWENLHRYDSKRGHYTGWLKGICANAITKYLAEMSLPMKVPREKMNSIYSVCLDDVDERYLVEKKLGDDILTREGEIL